MFVYVCRHVFLCRFEASDYVEVFITMGSIEVSLYATDVPIIAKDSRSEHTKVPDHDIGTECSHIPKTMQVSDSDYSCLN